MAEHLDLVIGPWRYDALAAGPPSGELVLLLHGFPQPASSWSAQLEALGDAGYRAVAPDQRGYSRGARPAEVSAYRLEHLVSDALGFADELGAERFHLVGHDWGGLVAWRLAADAPQRVRTLTVVSTPHPAAYGEAMVRGLQALRSSYVGLFKLPAVPDALLGAGGNAVLRLLLQASGLSGERARAYADRLQEPGALGAALSWYRANWPSTIATGPIDVPTLYVWGGKDLALGHVAARRTAAHVRGPYRFVPLHDAPHWIPEERPQALNDALLAHLAESSS